MPIAGLEMQQPMRGVGSGINEFKKGLKEGEQAAAADAAKPGDAPKPAEAAKPAEPEKK